MVFLNLLDPASAGAGARLESSAEAVLSWLLSVSTAWLGAGETASVELAFEVADALSRWDEFGAEWAPGTSPGWVVDVGRYGLHVGDCCVSGVVNSSATCPEGAQVSTSLEVT